MKTTRQNASKVSLTYNIFCIVSQSPFWCGKCTFQPKAGKRGEAGGGAKYLGPGLVRGARNLDKTSGHCATVKRVGGP